MLEQTAGSVESVERGVSGPPAWVVELLAGAPGGVERLEPDEDIEILRVEPGSLLAFCSRVRDAGFTVCLDVGGVDYLPHRPRFEVVYHFLALQADRSPQRPRRLRLRVPVPEEAPEVPSLAGLWPSANWAEREVYDLFGIRFTNHPELKRILMPDDWEGYPLRKDYPLRGPRAFEEAERPLGEQFDFLGARVVHRLPHSGRGHLAGEAADAGAGEQGRSRE